MKFAVRRNLMTADEGDRVLLEAKNARWPVIPPPAGEAEAARAAGMPVGPRTRPEPVRPAKPVVVRKPVKAAHRQGSAGQGEGRGEEVEARAARQAEPAHDGAQEKEVDGLPAR